MPDLLPPRDWWRDIPCGHPQDPELWRLPLGSYTCHCGRVWSASEVTDGEHGVYMNDLVDQHGQAASGWLVSCDRCGCHNLVRDTASVL